MSHLPISENSTGFDSFLSGLFARPVTAGSIAEEAMTIGESAITDRYVDACLMTHAPVTAHSSITFNSPVSAFA